MCNLCSGRLFLVPNPCCCCDLRCGVIWTGIFDFIIGFVPIYFASKREDGDSPNSELDIGDEPDPDAPVFDVTVSNSARLVLRCSTMQIISGIMIVCAAYGMGSRNLSRFLIGCTWLCVRLYMILSMLVVIQGMIKYPNDISLKRYGVYASIHLVLDIYQFIIVRYYTMECYDSYRYQRIVSLTPIRRERPSASKTAPETRVGMDKRKKKNAGKSQVGAGKKKNMQMEQVRDYFQKRSGRESNFYGEKERVPVWDRKNEVIFYGEDYTDWDPAVFLARWEILNEKRNQEEKDNRAKADLAKAQRPRPPHHPQNIQNPNSRMAGLTQLMMKK